MTRKSTWVASALLLTASHAAAAEPVPSAPELVRQRSGFQLEVAAQKARHEEAAKDSVRSLLQGELTVEATVRAALLGNQMLRAELEEIGVSRAELRQALLPQNPTVDAEIRFGRSGHPDELGVMQDLTSILLIPKRRQAMNAAARRATLRAANAALDLVAETRKGFLRVQAAEQTTRLWRETVASAEAAADLARRQHEAGNITDLELESEQANYEEAKIQLTRSQMETVTEREHLNATIGAWGELAEWRVEAPLPDLPGSDGSLENLEAAAITQRLDLAAAEAEIQSLTAQLPLARFSQFPELRAGVHVEREPEGRKTVGPAIELAVPIFDRGQHAVARMQAQLRQAEARHAALAIGTRSEVRAARERLIAERQLVEYYRDVVLPRRQRIVEQTRLEFNAMLLGAYQLLRARQDEVGARRDYINAQRDYWIARAELERALGGPVPAAE